VVGAIVIAENGGASGNGADGAVRRLDSTWGWRTRLASIPVIGCSTIVRTVEYLRQSGIDEISVFGGRSRGPLASSAPSDSEAEAWRSAARQLIAYRDDGLETVLLICASGYVELDLEGLVAQHRKERNVVSRAADRDGALDVWVIDSHRFGVDTDLSTLGSSSIPLFEFQGYINRLQGPQDVRRLAADLLTGKCRMRPRGTEVRPGVWIDEGAQVAKGARVVAPAYIGQEARIADDCLITRCSDVESNSQVDFGTAVEDTSILSQTYVGIGLDLAHSIVDGEEVLNLHHRVRLHIADPVVVRRNSPRSQQQHRAAHAEVSEVML